MDLFTFFTSYFSGSLEAEEVREEEDVKEGGGAEGEGVGGTDKEGRIKLF